MEEISTIYWKINDEFVSSSSCSAGPNDKIVARALFTNMTVGKKYRADVIITNPSNQQVKYSSPFIYADAISVGFNMPSLQYPINEGIYSVLWAILYDENNNVIVEGNGKGSGLCENVTVGYPKTVTIEVRNAQAGSGNYIKVYKNDVFYNDSRYLMYFDFKEGDKAEFEAIIINGWEFLYFESADGVKTTSNPVTVTVNISRSITAYFAEKISTSGYTCIDNCENKLLSGGTFKTQAECMADPCYKPPCEPSWICEQPLNGYEKDGCGNRRTNSACNPTPGCVPNWQCEQPLNGYEKDSCGNRRKNIKCNPATCTPEWQCEQPLNGYEKDGCGNRRTNPECESKCDKLGPISKILCKVNLPYIDNPIL